MNVSSRSSRELMDQHALSEYGTFLSSDPWDSRDQLSSESEDEDDPTIHYEAESTKTNPSSRLDPTAREFFPSPFLPSAPRTTTPSITNTSHPSIFTAPTRSSRSTAPTTVQTASSVVKRAGQPITAEVIMEENEPDSGPPTSTTVEDRNIRDDDEASIITQSSTYYSPEQREYVVKNLSLAIVRNLQTVSSPDTANREIGEHVMSHLRSAIKTFAETVEFDQSVREQAKAVRLVRRLRADIARELHASVLASTQSTETEQGLIDIGTKVEEMNLHDILGHWDPSMAENARIILDPHHESEAPTVQKWQSSSSSSFTNAIDSSTGSREFVLESRGDQEAVDRTHPTDKAEILKRFTQQPAFDTLVATTERLLEQYHFPKLDLIRYRVSRAIRRFSERHERNLTGVSSIVLKVGWDLRGFLRHNYQAGIHQKLGQIACITGLAENAKLCSVDEYLRWRWPHDSTTLLRAIEASLVAQEPSPPQQPLVISNSIKPDQTLQYFTVEGTEDFIITVAQQLSWLAAVCQEKTSVLKYAYVSFTEVDESSLQLAPTFEIDIALEDVAISDPQSCWNMLVGPAIVIAGFPVPDRKDNEKGLEVSIGTMAQLAGVPQAVSFRGGVVLKARCHAIVPTVDHGDSIQWHMIDTHPKRLEWGHIDELCPGRLQGLDIKPDFWGRRSFLGWCGRVKDLLGTSDIDYSAVQYSNAESPSRWAQVEKITLGFSQWGTLTTEITLGKKDGFSCQRPDDYDSLLDDASRTHVILHDTAHNRAFQTNAEDLILHILHHRRKQNLTRKGKSPEETTLDELLPANPDRNTTSTREVMMRNAEKLYSVSHQFSSPLPKHVLFKEEVRLLWTTIDGLWAHSYEGASSKAFLKLKLDTGHSLSGWEYMDVLGNIRHMEPKSVDLRRNYGRWNNFAKDIKAVVLFGAEFGDLLQPATRDGLCPALTSLPRDECYLSVRVDTLISLFNKQGSLRDQKKLTSSGLALQWPSQAFEHLHPDHISNVDCISQHTLRLARSSELKKNHVCMPLETYHQGAVIIGGRRPSFLPKVFQKEPQRATKQYQGQIPFRPITTQNLIQRPGSGDVCSRLPPPSGTTVITSSERNAVDGRSKEPGQRPISKNRGVSISSTLAERTSSKGFPSLITPPASTSGSKTLAPRSWSSVVAFGISPKTSVSGRTNASQSLEAAAERNSHDTTKINSHVKSKNNNTKPP